MGIVFKIRGSEKKYEWGKFDYKSMVAILLNSANDNFKVDEGVPYAELWLGTHVSGPSSIPHLGNKNLQEWLMENTHALGDNIISEFGTSTGLPFLFKVLSVNKALSIQAHPNKENAIKLHNEFPQHYPDGNHKPELAIALTNFEALCGFRPISEIKKFILEIKELKEVIGVEVSNAFLNSGSKDDLRTVFTVIMTLPQSDYQPLLIQIINNFKQDKYHDAQCISIKDIFLTTCEQYPLDIGLFCFFFLNYVNLKSGEAIFLAANEPHAYLYGDCIECMACSDNVVRAGLTPKYRDVQTLCNMLTYNCKSASENLFTPIEDPNDPFVKTYAPPVKEFSVNSISLSNYNKVYNLKPIPSASILLIIKGTGICQFDDQEINLDQGVSIFISSNSLVKITSHSDLLMFQAYCNG